MLNKIKKNKISKFVLVPVIIAMLTITSILIFADREVPDYEKPYIIISDNQQYWSTTFHTSNPVTWGINETAEWIDDKNVLLTLNLDSTDTTRYREPKSSLDLYLYFDINESLSSEDFFEMKKAAINFLDDLYDEENHNSYNDYSKTYQHIYVYMLNINDRTEYDSLNIKSTSSAKSYIKTLTLNDTDLHYLGLYVRDENVPENTLTDEDKIYVSIYKDKIKMSINGGTFKTYSSSIQTLSDLLNIGYFNNGEVYENLDVDTYIDNEYFTVLDENDIDASLGSYELNEDEVGNQNVLWHFDENQYISNTKQTMTIKLKLRDEYAGSTQILPTILRTAAYSKNSDHEAEINDEQTTALTLKHEVSYNPFDNLPEGCTASEFDFNSQFYSVGDIVTISGPEIKCDGYNFEGWKVYDIDHDYVTYTPYKFITKISDDKFIMPGSNVMIRPYWSKIEITKSSDETVYSSSAPNSISGMPDSMISDNNYVVFANMCWQTFGQHTEGMGTPLVYNGVYDKTSKSCVSGLSDTFGKKTSINLNGEYYYGTEYTFENDRFTLSGNIEKTTWNDNTYEGLIGKYTCRSTYKYSECEEIYYISEYNSSSTAYGFPILVNEKVTEGRETTLTFDSTVNTYMFGTRYQYDFTNHRFELQGTTNYYNWSIDNIDYVKGLYTCKNTQDKYCNELYKIVSYNNETTANVIPYKVNQGIGIIGNSNFESPSYSPFADGYMYGEKLKNDNKTLVKVNVVVDDIEDGYLDASSELFDFASTVTYDPDEGYRLQNIQSKSFDDNDIIGMYSFLTNSTDGTTIYYIHSYRYEGSVKQYRYIILHDGDTYNDVKKTYMYGDKLINNGDGTYDIKNVDDGGNEHNPTYVDNYDFEGIPNWKYICKLNSSGKCVAPVKSFSSTTTSFTYLLSYTFGKKFTYDENTNLYTLTDPISLLDYDDSSMFSSHHYTCLNDTGVCSKIYYVTNSREDRTVPENSYFAITTYELTDGNDIEDALKNYFEDNTNSSEIKLVVDEWFKNKLLSYIDYLEDSPFCGVSHKISDLGVYNYNGGTFGNSISFDTSTCAKYDTYTVSNESGNKKLTYPVFIPTENLGSINYPYWVYPKNNAPYTYYYVNEEGVQIAPNYGNYATYGIRPIIVLSPKASAGMGGSGTISNPFYINDGNDYEIDY